MTTSQRAEPAVNNPFLEHPAPDFAAMPRIVRGEAQPALAPG
jgi:hypothetical protein